MDIGVTVEIEQMRMRSVKNKVIGEWREEKVKNRLKEKEERRKKEQNKKEMEWEEEKRKRD